MARVQAFQLLTKLKPLKVRKWPWASKIWIKVAFPKEKLEIKFFSSSKEGQDQCYIYNVYKEEGETPCTLTVIHQQGISVAGFSSPSIVYNAW